MTEIDFTLEEIENIDFEMEYWNNKSDFSGSYNDLTDKPSINDIVLMGNKTLDDLNIASKDYVEQEIATFDFIKIVSELAETGLPNRTYLVSKLNATDNDLYDEYIWINKGNEEEPNWGWEFLGTKKIEVDLTDYVKNTDIATTTKLGLVKGGGQGVSVNNAGLLQLQMATKEMIDTRSSERRAIPMTLLDYAVGSTLKALTGYDSTKTQVLKNVNGTFTWVNE